MFKEAVEKATSLDNLSAFAQALEKFLVEAQLGLLRENPAKSLTALVKAQVLDPALDALKTTSSKPAQALYDAYADVAHFGTGCAQAAQDAGCEATDLAWLLSKAPEVSPESLKLSGALKKRRSKKK